MRKRAKQAGTNRTPAQRRFDRERELTMSAACRLDEIPDASSDALYDYMATAIATARSAYFNNRKSESEIQIGGRS